MTTPIPKSSIIADTHALLWYLLSDKKLSPTSQSILKAVDSGEQSLIIPAVVLAEMFMVIEKGRIAIPHDNFVTAVELWRQADNVQLTDLTAEYVIASADLIQIPDIFDRLIVTEARALNIPLITRDPVITQSKLVHVIW